MQPNWLHNACQRWWQDLIRRATIIYNYIIIYIGTIWTNIHTILFFKLVFSIIYTHYRIVVQRFGLPLLHWSKSYGDEVVDCSLKPHESRPFETDGLELVWVFHPWYLGWCRDLAPTVVRKTVGSRTLMKNLAPPTHQAAVELPFLPKSSLSSNKLLLHL